jgi:pyruvate carboxylase
LIFIGPTADVIESLGSKTKARAIAIKAGVPVIAGSDGPCSTIDVRIFFRMELPLSDEFFHDYAPSFERPKTFN